MELWLVDSFTDKPFGGNPAAVVLLGQRQLSSARMQALAAELNLSETVFVHDPERGLRRLRYFSPRQEIPLCGHATLAAAKVLFEATDERELRFVADGGARLAARLAEPGIAMDFPRYALESAEAPSALLAALGLGAIESAWFNRETGILMLVTNDCARLDRLAPDFDALRRSHDGIQGVLVTARSAAGEFDFHSRYFWPWSGSNEDPVTGATHTFLAPFWSERLGRRTVRSFQSSARGGSMQVEVGPEAIAITAQAVVVFEGQLTPDAWREGSTPP